VLRVTRTAGPRDRLFDLYRVAIDEYRFEVQLGWQRTSHLLTLDSGLFAASVGLARLGPAAGQSRAAALIGVVALIGVAVSVLGLSTLLTSRTYYERTKIKKTFLEQRLGLLHAQPASTSVFSNLAVTTTPGMADADAILADPDEWLRQRRFRWFRRAVTSYTAWLFVLLAMAHAVHGVVMVMGSP
jgi:hypothetical protein